MTVCEKCERTIGTDFNSGLCADCIRKDERSKFLKMLEDAFQPFSNTTSTPYIDGFNGALKYLNNKLKEKTPLLKIQAKDFEVPFSQSPFIMKFNTLVEAVEKLISKNEP